MRLTVLGAHGPYAPAGGATSSYLVEAAGIKILLDMGSGSLANMQRYAGMGDIDAIVLTHAHYDHAADFYLYKYALGILKKHAGPFKRPTVLVPEPCGLIAPGDEDILVPVYVCGAPRTEIGGITLDFLEMRHPARCFGVRLEAEGKVLAYTGDTNTCANIEPLVCGADMALVDAGLTAADGGENAPHLTIAEAARYAAMSRRGILTHIYPGYAREQILAEAAGLEIAKEGNAYDI